jgi:hypothetical protein
MEENANENRLSRWSRRKLQTLEQTQQEDLVSDLDKLENSVHLSESAITEEIESLEQEPDQPVLTDADMPSVETLNSESDFSMFMSSGVTDKLRNLALKQLFKAPLFNIRDGLDEYDEDYTFFEKLGDTVTCDMKHQMEMEALKKEEKQAEEAAALEADDAELSATSTDEGDADKEHLESNDEKDQACLEAESDVSIEETVQASVPNVEISTDTEVTKGE